MRDQDTIPTFDLAQRDDMGRLVGVVWHGSGAGGAQAGRTRWLVAVDGSACSLRAVAMVANMVALEIVAKADALGSRGIAIGSRGLTVTESLLLGSVAYKVVHLTKLPVLIVH
jgi:hypothetical protein